MDKGYPPPEEAQPLIAEMIRVKNNFGVGQLFNGRHIFEGVDYATKQKRRAKGKTQRAARKVHRAKGK